MNFFVAKHMTATTVMKNCVIFQKRIALYKTLYCFQSSEALGGFWSFLKLYMYIQIETFMYAITSHKKQRAKYQTEMLSRIAKQQFRYKQCFQQKKPWLETLMTRNPTAIMPIDIRKQAIEKKISASWILKTSCNNKSNEKRLETLFTHRQLNIYLHKLPFIVDLTDIKSWIVFKFNITSQLMTSAISMMQNAIRTFLLTFWRKVSSKPCQSMQISWRVVNCYCILNLHSSGISRKN